MKPKSDIRFILEVLAMSAVYVVILYVLCITVFRSTETTPRTAGISTTEAGSPARDKAVSTGTNPTHPNTARVNPQQTPPPRD